MDENRKVDFNSDRALRAWCVEMVWPRLYAYQVDEALEISAKLYDFVTGKGKPAKEVGGSPIVHVNINLGED